MVLSCHRPRWPAKPTREVGNSFTATKVHILVETGRYQVNTLGMKGNWKEISGKLKQRFANLTDDDVLFKEGKEEELMGRLQKKLGTTKEGLRKLIADL
jgi:uncharacterized protein YjbJ (UPF0337 family)